MLWCEGPDCFLSLPSRIRRTYFRFARQCCQVLSQSVSMLGGLFESMCSASDGLWGACKAVSGSASIKLSQVGRRRVGYGHGQIHLLEQVILRQTWEQAFVCGTESV